MDKLSEETEELRRALESGNTDGPHGVREEVGDVLFMAAKVARDNGIDHTVDIFPFYGSDVGAALRAGVDCKGALIGTGVCASHGMERTHLKGIEATLKLLYLYLCRED